MFFSEIIRFYSKEELKQKLVDISKNREVAVKYKEQFGTRPDSLLSPGDVAQNVQKGATSFHISVERWSNASLLKSNMGKQEMDALRIGWDLVFDIDCKILDYSKICAELICDALEFHSISAYSIKFSGGTGFHIGVPFESFPKEVNNSPTEKLFPELPRIIAGYIKEMIRPMLSERIVEHHSIKKISELSHKKQDELIKNGNFDPYVILDIDTIAISSRHLIRAPYSFNEKTWGISVPIKKEDISNFSPEIHAIPEKISFNMGFLETYKENEARELFLQALDWDLKIKLQEEQQRNDTFTMPTEAAPKELFPPCIQNIYKGMKEGRKRGLFILINFLRSCGWSDEGIEKEILEWNDLNGEPLSKSYVRSQLNWHKRLKDKYLTPACDNANYYKDIAVCTPDKICPFIKNPAAYPFKKRKFSFVNKSKTAP